jgi:DNA-binding SARP family transcriptional activator
MTKPRVHVAGRIMVELSGEVVLDEDDFRAQQDRLLFAYLVLTRHRPATREELARLLWIEDWPRAWASALSAVVSRLRSRLTRPQLASLGLNISGRFGQYRLDAPADMWVDVETAAHYLDVAEGCLRLGNPRGAFGASWTAAGIAARPFLSGNDCPWTDEQRRMLERIRVRALTCLAEVWLASEEWALAVEAGTQVLSIDPFYERPYRLLMEAHVHSGNPAQALLVYERLRAFLAEELGASPSRETEELHVALLRGG